MDHLVSKIIAGIGSTIIIPITSLIFVNPLSLPKQNPILETIAIGPTIIPEELFSPTIIPSITPSPTQIPTPTSKPSSTPLPTPLPLTSQMLDEWFTKYSSLYGVDRQKLWNIAVCESGLRTSAHNGDYLGLYQFSSSLWQNTRKQMNLDPNPSLRINPEEAIKTAAFKIAASGMSVWPNCLK